jgi:hypothetical protein
MQLILSELEGQVEDEVDAQEQRANREPRHDKRHELVNKLDKQGEATDQGVAGATKQVVETEHVEHERKEGAIQPAATLLDEVHQRGRYVGFCDGTSHIMQRPVLVRLAQELHTHGLSSVTRPE